MNVNELYEYDCSTPQGVFAELL